MCGILCVPFFGPVCRVEIRGSQSVQVCGTRAGFASRLQNSLHRGVLLANVSERPAIRIKVKSKSKKKRKCLFCGAVCSLEIIISAPNQGRIEQKVRCGNLVGVPGLIRPEQRFPKCVLCVCGCVGVCVSAHAGWRHRWRRSPPTLLSVKALGKSFGASELTIDWKASR